MDTRFLGQFLLLGLPGLELDRGTQRVIQDLQPGGFIVFSRNVADTRQLRRFTDTLRRLCTQEPIIAIDEEGGRVSRLGALGVTTPSPAVLAATGDPGYITMHARIISQALRMLGINMNLAPVLDMSLGNDVQDGALRQRCWGMDYQSIIQNAGIFLAELTKGGVLGCAKHFPTYTGAAVDPHEDLPGIPGTLEDLLAGPASPYLALGAQLPAVMTAHCRLPDITTTAGKPASLSPMLVQKFLRNQIGFNGLVITDDLDMGAIRGSNGLPDAACEAIHAGSDMAMVCHHPEEAFAIREELAKLPHPLLEDALLRIEAFRKQMPKTIAFREEPWQAMLAEAAELASELSGQVTAAENTPLSAVEKY